MIRVLVCGGRNYLDAAFVHRVLDKINRQVGIDCIIQGECPFGGADLLAKMFAICQHIEHEDYPPEIRDGKILGPRRNAQMLMHGEPDLVVAFPGDRGTRNMVSLATEADVPVWKPAERSLFGYVFPPNTGTFDLTV